MTAGNMMVAILAKNATTAQEVWEYNSRELTSALPTGLDESELHAALDAYPNKNGYKADNVVVDLSVVTDAINGLNNFDPTLDAVSVVNLVRTTEVNNDMRGTDGANTVVPANLTEVQTHARLDSYTNKDAWKSDTTVAESKLDSIETKIDYLPTEVWTYTI